MNTNNMISLLAILFASIMTMNVSWGEDEKPNNLMALIESGKIDELVDALGDIAELEATDTLGRNVVHYAAQHIKEPDCLIKVLNILLNKNVALAEMPDNEGKYPADLACTRKNKKLIEKLIAHYEKPWYCDENRFLFFQTCILAGSHLFARRGWINIQEANMTNFVTLVLLKGSQVYYCEKI